MQTHSNDQTKARKVQNEEIRGQKELNPSRKLTDLTD